MADINLEEFKITDAEVDGVKLEGTENPLRSESAEAGQRRFDAFPKMICVKFNAFVEKIVQTLNNLFSEAKLTSEKYADGVAGTAESNAKAYTDEQVGECLTIHPLVAYSSVNDGGISLEDVNLDDVKFVRLSGSVDYLSFDEPVLIVYNSNDSADFAFASNRNRSLLPDAKIVFESGSNLGFNSL